MFGWFRKKNQMSVTMWCNLCSAEPASTLIQMELEGEWQDINIGKSCLTRLREAGTLK